MINRFSRSLAVRLAILFGLMFAAGTAVLFVFLYWRLAAALEARDQADVVRQTERYAAAYHFGGLGAVRAQLQGDQEDLAIRSLFVRIVDDLGRTRLAWVPQEWVAEETSEVLLPDGWGGWRPQVMHTVRVPRDAERDLAVASQRLRDGSLLQVARRADSRAVLLEPLRRTFTLAGGAVLLVAILVGTIVARRSTAPLRAVTTTARRIVATGDLAERVPQPTGDDEVAELTRSFNSLLDKNAGLIRALRDTHDNLAHDLRTPLARLRGTAEFALQRADDPAATREALADCVEESERVLLLLETLLDVSAAESGTLALRRVPVDLAELAREAADLYQETAEEREILLDVQAEHPAWTEGDPVRLGQAVANLFDNAIKYTPSGGRVQVAAATLPTGEVELTVLDNGPGVPAAEREQIWRRLYRGDASRSQRGLGLGLSVVKAVVEAHGGKVAVQDAPNGPGASFSIRLPATSETPPGAR
jgi:signal transduction histidine kinase